MWALSSAARVPAPAAPRAGVAAKRRRRSSAAIVASSYESESDSESLLPRALGESWDKRAYLSYKDSFSAARGGLSNGARPAALQAVADARDIRETLYEEAGESWSSDGYGHLMALCRVGSLAPDSPVCCVMTTELLTAHPDTPLSAVGSLFALVSGLPVVHRASGRLVGLLCKGDLGRAAPGAVVQDIMVRAPLTAQPHNKLQEAAHTMQRYHVRRLPVVDRRGRCVGIVTRGDLMGALGEDWRGLRARPGTEVPGW